jgi:outer membrane protein insertion porin family
VSAGLIADRTTIRGNNSISELARDYILANGGTKTAYETTSTLVNDVIRDGATSTVDSITYQVPQAIYKGTFDALKLSLNWQYNSLNRPLFPTSGNRFGANLVSTVPGVSQDFQKLTLSGDFYKPITASHSWSARAYAKLGVGRDLPFYQNFFAGGIGSVRGYDNARLGPRSADLVEGIQFAQKGSPKCDLGTKVNITNFNSDGIDGSTQCAYVARLSDPLPEYVGGSLLTQFGAEIAFPLPSKDDWTNKIRPVLFIDGGNVFNNQSSFDVKEFRYGVGIGFTWMTFIGPISFHYTIPLNEQPGDATDKEAFEIGTIF